MRLVQVMVPAGKREAVRSALDEEGIDYALADETSGREYTAVVSFPLPTEAVEPVLERLREVGLERDAYTVVLDAETVISRQYEELERRYEEDEGTSEERIAREEVAARVEEVAPAWGIYIALTVISTVVATAGLLLNSPAIIVGSMIIAPIIGPAMETSVGTVIDDTDMFRRGVRLQVLGTVIAVGGAAVFASAVRYANVVPPGTEVFGITEVRSRLAPGVLSLPIALGAGAAAAFSLSSGVSTALVGALIAAAVVPPIAVVGIGLAWGAPLTVVGAGMLVVVNFFSINFAALSVLWYEGYRPADFFRLQEVRRETLKRIGVLGLGILLATVMLAGITYTSYQSAAFEDAVRQEAGAVVGDEGRVLDVEVTYGGYPFRQPTNVTVTVGYPPGTDPPTVVAPLTDRLVDDVPPQLGFDAGGNVSVSVRYIPVERAEIGRGA